MPTFQGAAISSLVLKGHYAVLEKGIQTQNLFSVENMVPSKKVKKKIKMKLCCPLRSVCLLHLISHEDKESLFI